MGILKDIEEIEEFEDKIVSSLCQNVDKYCREYQKVRKLTLRYIEELEKCGLEVDHFEIRRNEPIEKRKN